MEAVVPYRTELARARDFPSPPAARPRRSGDSGIRRRVPAAECPPRAWRPAAAKGGSLRDIKHVVILMQENRSFDHYFGTLPDVRGFSDPTAIKLSTGKPVFYQPDPDNPDGYLLPFHLDTKTTSAQAQPVDQPRVHRPALGLERREDGQLAARAPRRGRRQRPLHDGLPGRATTSRSSSRWPRTSPSATTTTARCSARPGRTGCTT